MNTSRPCAFRFIISNSFHSEDSLFQCVLPFRMMMGELHMQTLADISLHPVRLHANNTDTQAHTTWMKCDSNQ